VGSPTDPVRVGTLLLLAMHKLLMADPSAKLDWDN